MTDKPTDRPMTACTVLLLLLLLFLIYVRAAPVPYRPTDRRTDRLWTSYRCIISYHARFKRERERERESKKEREKGRKRERERERNNTAVRAIIMPAPMADTPYCCAHIHFWRTTQSNEPSCPNVNAAATRLPTPVHPPPPCLPFTALLWRPIIAHSVRQLLIHSYPPCARTWSPQTQTPSFYALQAHRITFELLHDAVVVLCSL